MRICDRCKKEIKGESILLMDKMDLCEPCYNEYLELKEKLLEDFKLRALDWVREGRK